MSALTRVERCALAIHDLGTRPGATHVTVFRALKEEGFTPAEIEKALKTFLGDDQ